MILICCTICTIPIEKRRLHLRMCRNGCNIHHVVGIPENTLPEDYDPQFFIDEIKRANRETIPEEEWLSDRLYYVDYKKKKNHLRTFV